MNVDQLVREIVGRMNALPYRSVQPIRELRREFSRRIKTWPAREVVAFADRLLDAPGPGYRHLASELLLFHAAALSSLTAADLKKLGRGLASWGDVDVFACYIAGPAWREGQATDKLIHGWAKSSDRWWRRAALVSTVPLNNKARGGAGDPKRTLAVCRLLIADRDDMVVKAMSWALRELAKREPNAVTEFVAEYKDKLAARVVREVKNKLTTGKKNAKGNASAMRR